MSLDKKAILKDIEVLIRSIKVHYDNIENEHRIPTIELELITSKIRKLHEKSIIYNHLHYMEEEQLQSTKRLKLDHIIFKHSSTDEKMGEISIEHKKNELFDSQIKFEEKVSIIEKEVIEPLEAEEPKAIVINEVVEEKIIINTIQETPASNAFKSIKLIAKIGINDRFRFIKNLFGGNGASMEAAINTLESCTSEQALNDCIVQLTKSNNWNIEDETVIDFLALAK